MSKRDILRKLLIVAGFGLLPFLLYGGVTLGSQTMLPVDNLFQWQPWASYAAQLGVGQPHNHLISDLILQNYAWKLFIRESVVAGEIPLWNPNLFGGVPFLAAGQHGAYYPFSLFFLILPLTKAYGWYTVSQLWLAGIFTYLLGRVLKMRRGSAVLAGLVFQGCGFMLVSAAVFPMILGAAIWLPLLLALLEMVLRRATETEMQRVGRTLPIAALGALALGIQILAGHIEITYYTLLVLAAYAGWRLLAFGYGLRRAGQPLARLVKPAAWVGGVVLLGLMLGGIQFIPFYEVGQSNFREGSAALSEVLDYGFKPRRILTLAMPDFFGNPTDHSYLDIFSGEREPFTVNAYGNVNPRGAGTSDWGTKNYVEGGIYLGILTLLLAGLGVMSWRLKRERRGPVLFFLGLTLLSLAFIFGTPLYAILYYGLPGINQLHSPFRWVFPLSICVAVLAGFGADYVAWSKERTGERHSSRLLRIWTFGARPDLVTGIAGFAIWGGLALLAGLVASWLAYDAIAPQVERLFMGLALAPEAFADARQFYSYEFQQALILGLMLLASGIALRVSRCPFMLARRPLWLFLAAITIALDLWLAGFGFNASADPALLQVRPALLEWLAEQPGDWRITTFDPTGAKPLNANAAWPYHLEDIRGYESVIPRQYVDYMAAIEPQNELQFNRIQPLMNWESINSPLLDLLGVKYIITTEQLDLPKLSLAWEGDGLRVYENLAVVPRAYTIPLSATSVETDVLAAVQEKDPRQYVLVSQETWEEHGEPDAVNGTPGGLDPAQVVQRSNRRVLVQAQVALPAWLVLNESYAPGWKAFVQPLSDGQSVGDETEVDVWLVNGNFRGVRLEAGEWQVRFQYSPSSFTLGGLTSFMAGMIILFTFVVWGWRRFYREEGELSNTRSIAKNSLAPMALNLFNRAIDFVYAAFYLRLLGPGDAGSFATAITIASLYEIVSNWGLNTLVIREVSKDRSQASRYLFNTTLLRFGTGLVAVLPIALYLGGRDLGGNPLALDTQLALILLMLGMIFSGMGSGITGLFYAYEEAEIPASVTTVTTILRVGFGVVVLLLGYGFVGLAAVSIVVNLVTLVILLAIGLYRFKLRGPWRLDLGLQRAMFGQSYPLMLNHLLATIFFFIDIPLLQQFKGDEAVGWYDSAYKYVKAFNIIPSFFTIALFPVISRQISHSIDDARRTFRMSVKLLLLVALPLASLTTVIAPLLIGALGGAAFLPDGALALRLMVWSIPFGWVNSVTNYVLIALGQERLQTRAFAAGVAFSIVANIIFIPLYSYRAAAVTTILSEIVLLIIFNIYLVRKMPDIGWVRLLLRPIAVSAIMIFTMIILTQVHWLAAAVGGLAVYGIGLFLFRIFGAEEKQILSNLLPEPVAIRLRLLE